MALNMLQCRACCCSSAVWEVAAVADSAHGMSVHACFSQSKLQHWCPCIRAHLILTETCLRDTHLSWTLCRAASQASAREEQLQSENAALKGEVAYLKKLLATACSEPSSMRCSPAHGAGAGGVGGASLLERAPAVPPSQAGGAAGLSTERLRMLQMRNCQLDRQIVLAQGHIQVTSWCERQSCCL